MRRFFNTAGPNREEDNYTIDPLSRLSSVRQLIDEKRYFILHAPRQTGKTTSMMALMHALNAEGKYIALYVNIEPAQAYRDNVESANKSILSSFEMHIKAFLSKELRPSDRCFEIKNSQNAMAEFIQNWIAELPKPLVLFLDEVDALIGDSLLSVLRQLRSGYNMRPHAFPHSIVMIGLRDIRDYRIFSGSTGNYVIGGSAFNIKDKSLTILNFTPEQVRKLFDQHTAVTGQIVDNEALDLIYWYTQGQPWLVNAIGRTICFDEMSIPFDQPVTAAHVRQAVEVLILRRDVHLDQLADKLSEPRVERIIQQILLGTEEIQEARDLSEDERYLVDLGLIRLGEYGLEIANPIYREVIPRELTHVSQRMLGQSPKWYILPDGKLDFTKVIDAFVDFYKEHGKAWLDKRAYYLEISHHLLLMAWLQRIVNGGGRIQREYAAGSGRIDLMIEFEGEKFVIEIKTEGNFRRERALNQTVEYAKRMGVDKALIAIFYTKYSPKKIGKWEKTRHENIDIQLLWL